MKDTTEAEYTPTMAIIRKAYRNSAYTGGGLPEMSDAEFDRALAAHDRAVEAKALRIAAGHVGPSLSDGVSGHTSTYSVRKWLRARADMIEGDTK